MNGMSDFMALETVDSTEVKPFPLMVDHSSDNLSCTGVIVSDLGFSAVSRGFAGSRSLHGLCLAFTDLLRSVYECRSQLDCFRVSFQPIPQLYILILLH